MFHVHISQLTAFAEGCNPATIAVPSGSTWAFSAPCNSAVSRFCHLGQGYRTGFGPVEYDAATGFLIFACVR
jgi:hypothetical protein